MSHSISDWAVQYQRRPIASLDEIKASLRLEGYLGDQDDMKHEVMEYIERDQAEGKWETGLRIF